MNLRIWLVGFILSTLAACTTVQRNTSVGAAAGGVAGAVIGSSSGHTAEGAVVGGALGAGAGYVLTPEEDK